MQQIKACLHIRQYSSRDGFTALRDVHSDTAFLRSMHKKAPCPKRQEASGRNGNNQSLFVLNNPEKLIYVLSPR